MKRLIINADDFGMSESVNYGIIKAYVDGIVSSTTLMPNMEAAIHAAELSKKYPDLFVGQHTNLVLGKPCSNPKDIPSLVDENGYFYPSSDYRNGKRILQYDDVKKEIIAQMYRFKELFGHYPAYIEGHAVFGNALSEALVDVAKDFKVNCSLLKDDCEKYGFKRIDPGMGAKDMKVMFSGITPDYFIDELGIDKLEDGGIYEFHFHPGYLDQFVLDHSTLTLGRCFDVATLCDIKVKEYIRESDYELISFGDAKL